MRYNVNFILWCFLLLKSPVSCAKKIPASEIDKDVAHNFPSRKVLLMSRVFCQYTIFSSSITLMNRTMVRSFGRYMESRNENKKLTQTLVNRAFFYYKSTCMQRTRKDSLDTKVLLMEWTFFVKRW